MALSCSLIMVHSRRFRMQMPILYSAVLAIDRMPDARPLHQEKDREKLDISSALKGKIKFHLN